MTSKNNEATESFITKLKSTFKGDVRTDESSRCIYSVDASIYEILPLAVAVPKDTNDIITAVKLCYHDHIPIIARGAGTGITGGCLGDGLVLDLSKYMNKILTIDYAQETVTCEPGVVQDHLNEALSSKNYRIGPETSTGNRATIGGMVANNAAGSHSLLYGTMVDHVLEVEVVLYTGEVIIFKEISDEEFKVKCLQQNLEGDIYRAVEHIRNTHKEEIIKAFPEMPRRVSGYNFDKIIGDGPINLAKIITGSEGSLGIVTKVKLKICQKPQKTGICIIHFATMHDAFESLAFILDHHPIAVELIDEKIINAGKRNPVLKNKLEWITGDEEAIIAVEMSCDGKNDLYSQLKHFVTDLKNNECGFYYTILMDRFQIENLWLLRKTGLGLLLSKRSFTRALAFIEDVSINPVHLPAFMTKFLGYLHSMNKEAGIYGHVGAGCIHLRPYINVRSNEDLQTMKKMMLDITELVLEFHGTLSGEHGDGLIRTWLNKKLFGDEVYTAFLELKRAFDPENIMNPGKVVNGQDVLENLRFNPNKPLVQINTFLNYSKEGGFPLAVDLCNGNGQCRKGEGVMCPSFQATGDEYDTTRARAQVLRAIINGNVTFDQMHHQAVLDVLDLCLECKGCKKECPSQINMAKFKAEMLYQYHTKYGTPLRNYLFGHIGKIQKWLSPFASIVNYLENSFIGKMTKKMMGLSLARPLPTLAKETFQTWLKKQKPPTANKKKVVLFNDTYTQFNEPEIGIAAYQVLEQLGYQVIIPPWKCCGRPLFSKGLLKQAQSKAIKLIELLDPYAEQGISIVGLEPSCILTIIDDYPDLVHSHKHQAVRVAKACVTFDHFLARHIVNGKLPLNFKKSKSKIQALVHGHCHQKTLVGMGSTIKVLTAIPGLISTKIDSGCCGVAGSFGYEQEHYDLSVKIGELKLLPTVRKADKSSLIIANGISCRNQIKHLSDREPLHLAQVVRGMLA